jgi:LysR family transcriptional regulator for metE and metH
LTEEGKVLYQTAIKVLDEIDRAMVNIQDLKFGHQGTIRLATECYTIYHWLPSFMRKMNLLYPKLEIKINMEATNKPLPRLLDNELDITVTSELVEDKRFTFIELLVLPLI